MYKNLLSLLCIIISINTYAIDLGGTANTPAFDGMGVKRPTLPNPQNVNLIIEALSLSTKQVCGYPDWVSTMLELPTQLATLQYFKQIKDQLLPIAAKQASSMAYAGFSVYFCRMFKDVCEWKRHYSLVAIQERLFTMNTCKDLESIGDKVGFRKQETALCITSYTNQGVDPGIAREKCLNGDNSKNTERGKTKFNGGYSSFESIYDDSFKDVDPKSNDISLWTKELQEKILPSSKTRKGKIDAVLPLSERIIEQRMSKDTQETIKLIDKILKKMVELHKKGLSKDQIVESTEKLWSDNLKFSEDKIPYGLYRVAPKGATGKMIIGPASIYQWAVTLAHPEITVEKRNIIISEISMLASTASYHRMVSLLFDMKSRINRSCNSFKRTDEISIRNCTLLKSIITSSTDFIYSARVADRDLMESTSGVKKHYFAEGKM